MITEELVDRLVEATNEAKATVRECHEARADLRLLLKEINEKLGTVKQDINDAFSEMSKAEWKRIFDEIDVSKMADGLKETFGKWSDLLVEATDVLASLHTKDSKLAEALVRIEARVRRVL